MILKTVVGTATAKCGTIYTLYQSATTGSPLVLCAKSGKYFSLPWEQIVDLAIKAGIDADPPKRFKCSDCTKTFPTPEKALLHKYKVHQS